jgi:hypothetical protein
VQFPHDTTVQKLFAVVNTLHDDLDIGLELCGSTSSQEISTQKKESRHTYLLCARLGQQHGQAKREHAKDVSADVARRAREVVLQRLVDHIDTKLELFSRNWPSISVSFYSIIPNTSVHLLIPSSASGKVSLYAEEKPVMVWSPVASSRASTICLGSPVTSGSFDIPCVSSDSEVPRQGLSLLLLSGERLKLELSQRLGKLHEILHGILRPLRPCVA